MDPNQLPAPLSAALLDGRLPALLMGVVLLLFGARIYRVLVVAPGVIAGVYVGAVAQELLKLTGTPAIVLTLVLVVAGALLCHFVEGMAVRVGGAGLFTAVAWLGWPLAQPGATPWWVPLAAAAVGSLAFPYLYQVLLRPLTALVGAWSVAFALQAQANLFVVGGLALAGTVAQFLMDRKGGEGSAPAKKAKKKK